MKDYRPMHIFCFFFFFFFLVGQIAVICCQKNTTTLITANIGVILDNESLTGKMALTCIQMAVSDFYLSNSHYKTRLILHPIDSKSDLVRTVSSAMDLIQNVKVRAILGSMSSTQAEYILALGENAQVPIISLSTSDPSLHHSSYFLEATQSLASEAKAISAVVKEFGWKTIITVVSDKLYGSGLISHLTKGLEQVDAHVSYVSVVSSSANESIIANELRKLTTMRTRVFVVHTDVSLGKRIFAKAREIGMIRQGFVWIVTNEMASFLSSVESSVLESSMQGVLGLKAYIPENRTQTKFRDRWMKLKIRLDNLDLNAFGMWAYDATTALAVAVEDVHNNVSLVSNLAIALTSVQLVNGVSGSFTLGSKWSDSIAYQLVNVYGSGQKVVGLLTPNKKEKQSNLTRLKTETMYGSWKVSNLAPIMWPGESTFTPSGWKIGSSRRLRVGVPSHGLLHVITSNNLSGYPVDMFFAVMKRLHYPIDFQFISFNGTYDELILQVSFGEFDVGLGDITITANRSLYVDFTFPFSETGVSIIMPVRLSNTTSTWIFFKPWTWDLWLLVAFFFIFNAFVVWVLEHNTNTDFQGPPLYQIGTSLWFSFSTMVYAHQENLVNNMSRFVVVVWIFVVLILTQCYAAGLTSFLTVRQLQPPKIDLVLIDLIRSGKTVAFGVSPGLYVGLKNIGFDDSQLRQYMSNEEAHNLISNGIVAAIVNEVPYNKLFLAKYCSGSGYYDFIERRIRADGFGFAFQRGSPLMPDFSRELMRMMSGTNIVTQIENKWFGRNIKCKEHEDEVNYSNRFGTESLWGLFLIVGVSSLSALAIHAGAIFHGRNG